MCLICLVLICSVLIFGLFWRWFWFCVVVVLVRRSVFCWSRFLCVGFDVDVFSGLVFVECFVQVC